MIYAEAYGDLYYIISPGRRYIIFCLSKIYHTEGISLILNDVLRYEIIIHEVLFLKENKLVDLSMKFAVQIVELVDEIEVKKSGYMLNQLGRAGTSIGANICEAQYAHSKADFIAKLEISLKESFETSYWLQLLFKTGRINEQTFINADKLCGNIRRLLIASCTTAKENSKK